ncbi:twin-arginine translocation signal domain-containing protein [Sulfolobus sp. S-194]|uniref:twin-arginine translocation signal domain-containing protein n=1 Tax=Sulfolobus sp. S-194 TaxID=2512240 RepID=UPI001437212C|nr:twin-arginine translocation signal domain-containing protein [Sulfolobus sp. S-194]QIW24752.1 twin-arginine translocation signal domain-containing protein [Sulfolobus sp. S-194]
MSNLKLTRRDFLKLSGITALTTAILLEGGSVIDKVFRGQEDFTYTLNYPNDEVVYGNCFQCLGRCSLEIVRTPQGFPRFITGTIGWHINDGGVCPRGASDVYYYFAPARLRFPLLRASDRGSGKWIAIDYDTAYDIIINGANASSWSKLGLSPQQLGIGNFSGLLKIREENPHALAFFQGRDQLIPGITAGFFAGNYGTANSGAHGGFCSMNVYTAGVYVTGAPVWEYAGPDEERAQYFILAGLAGDHFPNWMRRIIARIRENGGKVVTIAPERFGFYSVSDEHLFINPATDGALAMGWIRALVDFHYYVYKAYLASTGQGSPVLNPQTLQPVSPAYDPSSGQLIMQTVTPNGQVVQLPQFGDIPQTAVFPHVDEEFLRYYTNLSWLVIVNPNPQNGDCLDPTDPTAGNNVGLHLRMPVSNEEYSSSHPWLEAIMGSDGNVYSYVDTPWQKGVFPILTLDELPSSMQSQIIQVPYKLKNGQVVKVPAIQVTVPKALGSNETITLTVTTAFELFRAELLNYDPYTPYQQSPQYGVLNVADVTGIPHNTIVRIANEIATVAFQKSIYEPAKWIDYLGRYHDHVVGRPVSIYFMRGLAAHANGFMSAAAYYYLVLVIGAWDNPGADLYKYPYPHYFPGHAVPPHPLANTPTLDPDITSAIQGSNLTFPKTRSGFLKTEYIYNDGTVDIKNVEIVGAGPYGFPDGPDDLVIYKTGRPLLVDRGYSWEIPLTTQRSISAVAYTTYFMNKYPNQVVPYTVQAMMWYITAPYWNNAYTLTDLLQKVTEKDNNGNYIIPFTISIDLFMQETNNVVDLVIPDLSFLEIYGFHSTFDRPTSLPQGPSDSLNWPVLPAMYPVLSAGDFLLTLAWLLRIYPNQSNTIDPTKNPHYTTQDPVTGLPLISPVTIHDPVTGTTILQQGQPGLISSGMFILKGGILIAGYGSNFEYILTDAEGKQSPNPQQLKLYASFVPNGANQQDVINQILNSVPQGQNFSTAPTYKIAANQRSSGIEHYFRIPVKFQPKLKQMLQNIITKYAAGQMTLEDINPGFVKVGKGGAVYVLPPSIRYMRNVNMFYFKGWGAYMPGAYGPIGLPYVHRIYLEYLQKFRLAAAGKWQGYNAAYYYFYLKTGNSQFLVKSVLPSDSYGQALAKNLLDYHRPFGGYYPPPAWKSEITSDGIDLNEYPLTFFVRRHDRTYHSWSFNVPWLTAIMPYTPVMLSSADPYVKSMGIQSGDFVQFEAVNEPWSGGLRTTLTAIAFLDNATRPGAAWVVVSAQALPNFRGMTPDSPQVKYSILNNWANISYMPPSRGGQLLPQSDNAFPIMYLDPITGQTAWHDSRIKIVGKVSATKTSVTANRFVYMGQDFSNQDILSVIVNQMSGQISVSGASNGAPFAQAVDIPHLRFNANNMQSTSLWSYVAPYSLASNDYKLGNYKIRYGFAGESSSS